MNRPLVRITVTVILAWLAIRYVVQSLVETTSRLDTTSNLGPVYSLTAAQVLLVGAWAWLLWTARKLHSAPVRLGLQTTAVGIVVLLFVLRSAPNGAVVVPALTLTAQITGVYLLALFLMARPGTLSILLVLGLAASAVLSLWAGGFYFGLVLMSIGFFAIPRNIGSLLREIFPPPLKSEGRP